MREIHHGRRLPVNTGVRGQVSETHGWAPQCRAPLRSLLVLTWVLGLDSGCGVQTWLNLLSFFLYVPGCGDVSIYPASLGGDNKELYNSVLANEMKVEILGGVHSGIP